LRSDADDFLDRPHRFQRIDIQENSWKEMRPLRRDMQIVFQDPFGALSPRMSVADIVGEGLEVHFPGISAEERDRRVAGRAGGGRPRCLHAFPLSARVFRRSAPAHLHCPGHGSGAEIRHAGRTDLGARHERSGAGGRPLARPAAAHGLAYLFISHDLESRAGARQRGCRHAQGKVVESGPADKIFDAPETDYTKALMAAAFRLETAPEGVVSM
jgi:microcin C transport system ATP-binding protein